MKKIVEFPDTRAIKEEAAEWLVRLDGDRELTRDERLELREWLQRSQAHRDQLRSLAELWAKMNVLTELAAPIGDQRPSRSAVAQKFSRPLWSIAAGVLLGIMAVFAILNGALFDSTESSNGLYATAIGAQQSVTLDDASIVLLNTDSQMRVDFDEQHRDIHLIKGEAHFTVAKDSKRRFRVFAGTGRIEAVGTAFSVHMKDDSVDVVVTEGRVALASAGPSAIPAASRAQSGDGSPGIVRLASRITALGELKAGQVATIRPTIGSPEAPGAILSDLKDVTDRDLSRRIAWTGGTLILSGKTLAEAVGEISRYTPVKIEFSDPAVGAMLVGGLFPVGETELMFETLENYFGVDVTYLSETHVLISAVDSN